MEQKPFTIIYAKVVSAHMKAIDAKYRTLILDKMEEQLSFQPDVETKNRKRLRKPAPFDASWEIRFGPGNRFRILYEVDVDKRVVEILGVGEKDRDRLLFAGEEVRL